MLLENVSAPPFFGVWEVVGGAIAAKCLWRFLLDNRTKVCGSMSSSQSVELIRFRLEDVDVVLWEVVEELEASEVGGVSIRSIHSSTEVENAEGRAS